MPQDDLLAELAAWDWQEGQAIAISAQLDAAFPDLETQIRALVAASSFRRAVLSRGLKAPLKTLFDTWALEQTAEALRRAERDLAEQQALLPPGPDVGGGLAPAARAVAPMLLGGALAAAAVPAGSMALSAAVQTSTVLFFFSTSTVSVPILMAGLAGAGLLGVGGVSVLGLNARKPWQMLEARCIAAARLWVFGRTGAPGEESLLNNIQDNVRAQVFAGPLCGKDS